ncbi:hypothetical protein [Mycobacterium ulcerans]|uniref:hypothetical protein n=1 Tax=Mycobacterium ulcerans TaxID=1809 RepID=UPI001FFCF18A|nr:hypothetical protein [Mycobacterium ulcerans]
MRLLDLRDIGSHAKTFTKDATFEHIPGAGPVSTRAAIEKALLKVGQQSWGCDSTTALVVDDRLGVA